MFLRDRKLLLLSKCLQSDRVSIISNNQFFKEYSIWNVCYLTCVGIKWAESSEFGTYRLCEQRRFRRACASAQSRQNLRCSLIQTASQEEPSNRKPDPWPLWMARHAQLKFVMMECSKTQIRLTRHKCKMEKQTIVFSIFDALQWW